MAHLDRHHTIHSERGHVSRLEQRLNSPDS